MEQQLNNDNEIKPDDSKYALEKYKITLDFLRFEATTLWQIFNAFFIGNAIFVAFISTALVKYNDINFALLLVAGIFGLILSTLWFITTYTNGKWYYFRMTQSKNAERNFVKCNNDDSWFLLNNEAESFANSQFKIKYAAYTMIAIFIITHAIIIICSLIKLICCSG